MAEYPIIKDKQAHSWPEVYLAYALDKADIPYYYQYEIGNRLLRGAMIVDFVLTRPYPQPVEIFGEYWHRTSLRPFDAMRLAVIRQVFGRECIVVEASDIDTQSKADKYVRDELQ